MCIRDRYYAGYDRGQAAADRVIADHLVDRLIDNPQDVDNLDGTFLEVEEMCIRDRIWNLLEAIRISAHLLMPLMPSTSAEALRRIGCEGEAATDDLSLIHIYCASCRRSISISKEWHGLLAMTWGSG